MHIRFELENTILDPLRLNNTRAEEIRQMIRVAKVQRILLNEIYERGFVLVDRSDVLDTVITMLMDAKQHTWHYVITAELPSIRNSLSAISPLQPIYQLGWSVVYLGLVTENFSYGVMCNAVCSLGKCSNQMMGLVSGEEDGYAVVMNILRDV